MATIGIVKINLLSLVGSLVIEYNEYVTITNTETISNE